MWARKRLDIGWSDLACGLAAACWPRPRARCLEAAEAAWSPEGDSLVCLSVRTGFDLCLKALDLPPGSEILMSALTIPDMPRIVAAHGLVPVPVDVEPGCLGPDVERLRQALTPATKAVVVAHLLGARLDLAPVLALARERGLVVIEDCAQAYTGGSYRGHPEADVSMFSFGTIKTATALGGAALCVRRPGLLARMRALEAGYPLQPRAAFAGRVAKYAVLKLLSARALFGLLVRLWQAAGFDYDRWINGLVKGFAGERFFDRIRRRPSAPLLALLAHRWRHCEENRCARRERLGQALAGRLRGVVACPGVQAPFHSYWVFPVLAEQPARLVEALRKNGFDATQGHSMCVVPAPSAEHRAATPVAEHFLAHAVYLPMYPELTVSAVAQMADVVADACQAPASANPPAPLAELPYASMPVAAVKQ